MNSDPCEFEIRESLPGDASEIKQLYRDAIPDEDLSAQVSEILDLGEGAISLVAMREIIVAGHISFTFCHIEGDREQVALLAPLAVTPGSQKQGIGSALIHAGLQYVRNSETCHVYVLGDPAWYGRFGFEAEDKVTTPYPLPAEWDGAWQSLKLCDATAPPEGKLWVPNLWRHKALWTS